MSLYPMAFDHRGASPTRRVGNIGVCTHDSDLRPYNELSWDVEKMLDATALMFPPAAIAAAALHTVSGNPRLASTALLGAVNMAMTGLRVTPTREGTPTPAELYDASVRMGEQQFYVQMGGESDQVEMGCSSARRQLTVMHINSCRDLHTLRCVRKAIKLEELKVENFSCCRLCQQWASSLACTP